MSITTLFHNPHLLHQTADDDTIAVPEPAIAGSTDICGLIILSQEGRESCSTEPASTSSSRWFAN